MKMVPMHGKVIIEREVAAEKTPGGIYMPDTAKDKPHRGKVIAAAEGRYQGGTLIKSMLKAGDTVLFGAFAGGEVELDGKKLLVMDESEVLAVLRK